MTEIAATLFIVWIMLAFLTFIAGISIDAVKGKLHLHSQRSVTLYFLLCLLLMPLALYIVLKEWLNHR